MSGRRVALKSRTDEHFYAYHAVPERPNGGGVIVLQEIFGVNANIRSVADQFADAGYHAIAPDFFWRQTPEVELDPTGEADRNRAGELLRGLDQKLAVQDAMQAAAFLRTQPDSNGKVGAVGYCLGGKLAYLVAMEPGIDAAVSYYGVAIQAAIDMIGEVRAPLLLHLAESDHLCPPEAQAVIEAAAIGVEHVAVMRHTGVGHAFARRRSEAFDAGATRAADAATLALLAAEVGRRA